MDKKCHFRKVIAHILCRFGSRYWNIRSCLRRVAATKSPSSFEIRNMRECWADCSFLRMLGANGPVTYRIELTVPVDSVADWLEKSILVQSHRPHYILYFPLILLHRSLTRCFIIYFYPIIHRIHSIETINNSNFLFIRQMCSSSICQGVWKFRSTRRIFQFNPWRNRQLRVRCDCSIRCTAWKQRHIAV